MLALLINLILICVILGILWWILTLIPIPPPMTWIVRVVFALICLLLVLSLLTGSWSFPIRLVH